MKIPMFNLKPRKPNNNKYLNLFPMRRYCSLIFLLLPALLVFHATQVQAQYGNEWIDHSKTYWKFKVGTEGIFRIHKSLLDMAGVPASATGADYVLYRDGKEIALFVSNAAAFGAADYIEFFGTANDGLLDKELYLSAEKYTNDNVSLFNDTAAYFLTVDNSTVHKRYQAISTPIPGIPPAASTYCRATVMQNGKDFFLPGKTNGPIDLAYGGIRELYSSQFDHGEGYYLQAYNSVTPASITINTPNLVTGALSARLQTAGIGRSRNSIHKMKMELNSVLKADVVYGISDIQRFDMLVPSTELSASNTLTFTHTETGVADNFYIVFWEVEYPRNWNFSGADFFRFKVDAGSSAQYIEITGFNHGGSNPRLYDLSNQKYYTGDISVSGKTRFYIDPSFTDMEMVLYAPAGSKVLSPGFSSQRVFTDFSSAANQGDYMIISHRNLSATEDGHNYIQEYKDYRSSAAGGGHRVIAADIEELYDQYAYGIFTHPLAITHFVDFGLDRWTTKPKTVFLIGKGVVYTGYKQFAQSPLASNFQGIVPTYGHPGSDVAFVTDRTNWKMKVNIGRLSAWNTSEVGNYLNKVKQYEAALMPAAFPTPATELWKKQVLHIAGSDRSDVGLQAGTLLPTLAYAQSIISRPSAGGVVTTVAKSTKGEPTTIMDKKVDSLITNGLSLITYYGHGSASALDYNIKDPSEFTSLPRLPVFDAYGCDISTIYESTIVKTISEKFVSAPQSGAIVTMASNNQGYTDIHSKYMPILYAKIAKDNYGQTIGDQYHAAHDSCTADGAETPNETSKKQTHMESFIMQGDPGTYIAVSAAKTDYYVGNEGLSTLPVNITTALDSFQLRIASYNIGRSINDTVQVKIEHTNPEGKLSLTKTYAIIRMDNSNVTQVWLPIDKTRDLGINKYKVMIDASGRYDEQSEANNVAMIDVFILSDNIVPVYPYNFSIVHKADLELKASTLNPFKGFGRYKIEIDTTELFNSPGKMQTVADSKGGVIKWKPGLLMQDSMVYYWRTSIEDGSGNYTWAASSFVYLKNGSDGWNQSHYYQYKYNAFDALQYGTNRKFQYNKSFVTIRDLSTIMNMPAPYIYYGSGDDNRVFYNGADLQRYECDYSGTLQIIVFDSSSGKAWENPPAGRQGSNPRCGLSQRNVNCFSFDLYNAEGRNNGRKFLDSIPDGNYVFVRNCIAYNIWGGYYVSTWANDTLTYGSGNSLYHSMRKLGFSQIDSFYQPRVFSMLCKKGSADFPIEQHFATGINEVLDISYTIPVSDVSGRMNSVVLGAARKWNTLKWRTSSYFDTATLADSAVVRITGIERSGTETFLYEGGLRDADLGFISAATYPKLRLQWFNRDTVYHTAPQLDYWRVLYDPLPEAALNPAAYYSFTDSVSVGQLMNMETAVETLTELPMDSMLVRYKVIDANGVGHLLGDRKYRNLKGNDTLHAAFSFDPKPYPGKNYLFIEANPDQHQPEQYHPNNLGYIPFDIKTDQYNPLLDVTFDGIHILDRDIVSARPFIKVLLRDENKFLALNDTASMKLFLRYPGEPEDTRNRIPFDGAICKFVPADVSAGKNEAFIEYKPAFTKDGIYQLYARGTDASGNDAGGGVNEYSISFEVINKSSITNLLNYPNPFSTSTAFVFELTGWKIPSQFKIQILSITGKVVREITRQEIGNIHIGRNVTEYKWDGKDQYGQVLGNGVYLYRVVTAINGENIERRENAAVDKFYKNGYSKMYIMR
jgi:hypothetical protein